MILIKKYWITVFFLVWGIGGLFGTMYAKQIGYNENSQFTYEHFYSNLILENMVYKPSRMFINVIGPVIDPFIPGCKVRVNMCDGAITNKLAESIYHFLYKFFFILLPFVGFGLDKLRHRFLQNKS